MLDIPWDQPATLIDLDGKPPSISSVRDCVRHFAILTPEAQQKARMLLTRPTFRADRKSRTRSLNPADRSPSARRWRFNFVRNALMVVVGSPAGQDGTPMKKKRRYLTATLPDGYVKTIGPTTDSFTHYWRIVAELENGKTEVFWGHTRSLAEANRKNAPAREAARMRGCVTHGRASALLA